MVVLHRNTLLAFLAIAVVPVLVSCTSSTPTPTFTPVPPPTPTTTPTPLPTAAPTAAPKPTPTLTLQDQLLQELVDARATATALTPTPAPPPTSTADTTFYAPFASVPAGGGCASTPAASEFVLFPGWEVLEAATAAVQGEHSGRVESEFVLDLGEFNGVRVLASESTTGVWKTPDRAHLSITISRQGLPSVEIDGRTVEIPDYSETHEVSSSEMMYT